VKVVAGIEVVDADVCSYLGNCLLRWLDKVDGGNVSQRVTLLRAAQVQKQGYAKGRELFGGEEGGNDALANVVVEQDFPLMLCCLVVVVVTINRSISITCICIAVEPEQTLNGAALQRPEVHSTGQVVVRGTVWVAAGRWLTPVVVVLAVRLSAAWGCHAPVPPLVRNSLVGRQ
jgi:hypothetical protein